jgi:hypothetical protein
MRVFAMAVVGIGVAFSAPAHAACGAVCQQKCQQYHGNQTVANCVKLWSCINAKYGARAGQFVNAEPPPECKRFYKPNG